MSFLSQITLTQFRNFNFQSFLFHKHIIGITGQNGTGKTNLLDAIYYLCYTKSYFQSKEINNTQTGSNGFRIQGTWKAFENNEDSSQQTVCIWREGKKTIEHNKTIYTKTTEHIGKFNAVMIAPDDIEIINGGSEVRRKFIDGLLAQSDPEYLHHLLSYQKNLQQKNAYLKQNLSQPISSDLLDIYDEQLSIHGSYLISKRKEAAGILPVWVKEFYNQLSSNNEEIAIRYKYCAEPNNLKALFLKSRQKEIEFRRTLNGPHTEDWLFALNNSPFKSHASQGQKKSMLISLKLAHLKWLQNIGKQPILLLDDIFEKLDQQRLLQLFRLLKQFSLHQIFMTHTNKEELRKAVMNYYDDVEVIELG